MIDYKCQSCGEPMQAPNSLAGQDDKCPSCGALCRIPSRPHPRYFRKPTRPWCPPPCIRNHRQRLFARGLLGSGGF